MKRLPATVFVVALFIVVACGSAAPSSAPLASLPSGNPLGSPSLSFEPGSASDVGRYFKISEVGLAPNGYVTLVNYTDQPANLKTLYLCQATGCVNLPDFVVQPGAAARIAVGNGAGLKDVAMTGAKLDLPPANGEVALYSSNDINDQRSLHAYLEWGSTPHTITPLAIKDGIWLTGSFAPTSAKATRLFQNDSGLWLFDE